VIELRRTEKGRGIPAPFFIEVPEIILLEADQPDLSLCCRGAAVSFEIIRKLSLFHRVNSAIRTDAGSYSFHEE
jgi:hypothetical protein